MSAHIKQSASIVAHEIQRFLDISKPCDHDDIETQKIVQAEHLHKIVQDLGEMVGHIIDAIDLEDEDHSLRMMRCKISDFSFEEETDDIIYVATQAIFDNEQTTTTDFEEHSTWGMGFDRHNQK